MAQPPSLEFQKEGAKKTRLRGSCDECRRRKAKCDSAKMPGKVCSNCIALKIECRHDFSNRLKPTVEYTQALEERIAKFEAYFRRTHPGEDIDQIIERNPPETMHTLQTHMSSEVAFLRSTRKDELESSDDESDDVPDSVQLSNLLSKLSINHERKFFGQSSAFSFAKTAASVGRESDATDDVATEGQKYRRPFFWEITPWELEYATSEEAPYVYPEQDLLFSLVSLYFDKTNALVPVLHRPTFIKALLSGQHISDPSFGMTVLLVCALGSRYSDDQRVYMPNDLLGMSAGWRFFSQVPTHRRRMLCKSSTLYDLQYYALGALYLQGCSNPNSTWHMVGIGLRYAIEKGAHRRKPLGTQRPNAEDELQKRAFWTLVSLDRSISSFVGRPYAYPHELIDVEYPIECDDEYWFTDDPTKAFKQPPGKPCTIAAFVYFIKLCDILGFATRILYSNKECRQAAGSFGPDGEEKMVPELDSALNKWRDSLPDHLIWDPHCEDPIFFHQSANLYAFYHYIQIQIHRPFLTKKSSLTYASLAMCTTAARSCSRILETAVTRGLRVSPITTSAIFTAGLFIVFALRNSRNSSASVRDREEDTQNLQRCVNFLKECERKRWHNAGRLGDMLMAVGSVTRYETSAGTRKRRRQSLDPADTTSRPSNFQPDPINLLSLEPEGYAGSESGSASESSIMDAYTLTAPMTNWDLHRLLMLDNIHLQINHPNGNDPGSLFGFDTSSGSVFGDIPFDIGGMSDSNATAASYYTMSASTATAQAQAGAPQANSQVSSFNGPDMFSWQWPEVPTAFRSFEEWETHLATGGRT